MAEAAAVTEITFLAVTDAGMHALWNPSRFTGITDYETWEDALLEDEDIVQHVRAGALVPIYLHSDGAFQFLVRVGTVSDPPALTSRERQHLLVSSQPYRYLSDGTGRLTGIEDIGAEPGSDTPVLAVPAGPNAVTVHLIDWSAEPGARDDQGKPTSGALPDFVVLISPAGDTEITYRTELQTFDRG